MLQLLKFSVNAISHQCDVKIWCTMVENLHQIFHIDNYAHRVRCELSTLLYTIFVNEAQ